MAVTAKAFQLWRSQIAPQDTVSDVCRVADIKRSTLAQQLVRGKVSVSTVVAIARGYGLPIVGALAVFDGFEDVPDGVRDPTDAELVSQVSHIDILRLLVARSRDEECAGSDLQLDLAPFPHRNSVRAWIEAIDPGDLRQRLATSTGVARQNLSAQLTAGRLVPEIAVEAARIAGVSLTSGLVVTGLLTPAEGGWPPDGRSRALCAMSDLDLVFLARDRLDVLGKQIRRAELEDGRDRTIFAALVLLTVAVALSLGPIYEGVDGVLGGVNLANLLLRLALYAVFLLLGVRMAAAFGSSLARRLIVGPVGLAILGLTVAATVYFFVTSDLPVSAVGLREYNGQETVQHYATVGRLYPGYVAACLVLPAAAAVVDRHALPIHRVASAFLAGGFSLVVAFVVLRLTPLEVTAWDVILPFSAILMTVLGLSLIWLSHVLGRRTSRRANNLA
ncbi:Uncharacterised protein [Arthrobacter agilis]|nr:hypothetical protein [Arthrobacter agilis]VDR30884.1 Uncharacterised protein [Arthrobacter agilis]